MMTKDKQCVACGTFGLDVAGNCLGCKRSAASGFTKFDTGKVRESLFPVDAYLAILDILEHGAQKYGADNWRECKDMDRYADAAARHRIAYRKGERIDGDSGLLTKAHEIASGIFQLQKDIEESST